MATTGTLLSLPPQPLPKGDLADSIFVIFCWFATTCFAFVFSWLLNIPYARVPLNWVSPRSRPTWDTFRSICLATGILAFWYFFLMIDRWIHWNQRPSAYGYIIFLTLIESLRVLSAVIFAWGNYRVVWVEIETRANEFWQRWLWVAAKVTLFLVSLVSILYALLYLALAIVWLEFRSPNSIADIATKRTSLEVSMAALLTAFSLLTIGALWYAIQLQARKVDGKGNSAWKSRWPLFSATFMFFMRCLVEFALLLHMLGPNATRRSLNLTRDVSYGLLSCLYLLSIALQACMVSSPDDRGNRKTQDIRANVRRYIDEMLSMVTEDARKAAPPFLDIMEKVEEAFENDIGGLKARFYAGSTLSDQVSRETIEEYFRLLRKNFGHLGSDEPTESEPTSPYQSTTSLLSNIGHTIGHRVFGVASDPNMHGTSKKRSNRSLLDAFQGRRSAPPTMSGRHDEPDANVDNIDAFDGDTNSEWTRTDYMSRRGSVARSHRYSSAPHRPLATHMESQFEMAPATSFGPSGVGRDSRIVTDPTALSSTQERFELGNPEPPSPQELGLEQLRRPGYPLSAYRDGSPARMRRQRPSLYGDQPRDAGFDTEPSGQYRPYRPLAAAAAAAAVAPPSPGPLNSYAARARSLRRQRTGSEVGAPGTPSLHQTLPRVPVGRRHAATPDHIHHAQGLLAPGGLPVQLSDMSSGPPPASPLPAMGDDVSGPLLPAATDQSSGPPRPTMRFQVGGRNRQVQSAQPLPSQGEGP